MYAIADGGANEILFPLHYEGLSHVSLTPSEAIMADGSSTLQLHGTARYGVSHVLLSDVMRPIWYVTKHVSYTQLKLPMKRFLLCAVVAAR